jgi:Flp pilus assembly protein CpaB
MGTIVLAGLAALVASALILVYLTRYRDSVRSGAAPVAVLVAREAIPKGMSGNAVSAKALYQATTIRANQLRDGAFSDPSSLQGRVATQDIAPGQQLTAGEFATSTNALSARLVDRQRAITVPLDSAHGLIGQVQAGDHVDVLAGFNVIPLGPGGVPLTSGAQSRPMLRTIMQNIPVLGISHGSTGIGQNGPSNVTLRVTPEEAAELAFASDNGKVWLVLRPASGAPLAKPGIVTVETMLLGIPPITIVRSLGGRP